MENNNIRKLILGLCTLAVVAAMITAAEMTGEKEIIFPEVTALAVGMFMAPHLPWKTNYRRMLVCITLCAVLGLLISMFMPGPLWLKMFAAYGISQFVFLLSRTGLAPMISAIVLPVLLGSEAVIYPIAAFLLTLAIILIRVLLDQTGLKERVEFIPHEFPHPSKIKAAALRSVFVLLLVYPALRFGMRFCVAPPLLVAFTELSTPHCKIAGKPVQVVLTVSICALIGAMCRYLIAMQLGASLILAVIVAVVLMLLWLEAFHFHLPPAAAMTVLAMLIPEQMVLVYPLQVLIGIMILFPAGRLLAFISEQYMN